MKILYGIQLNGNGHITRSIELISILKERGCEVDIITSGNNSNLEIPFKVKKHFQGFSIYYNKFGSIDWIKSISSSKLIRLLKDIKYDVSDYDLVISDFEPVSAWSARMCKVKSIGISNQCSLISKNTPKYKRKFISKLFIKYFAKCDDYIGLHYQSYDDYIQLPFISRFFLENKTSDKNFYLIYLPSLNLDFIIKQVNLYKKINFKIYSGEVEEDANFNNIEIKKLNKSSFQRDILDCTGVITASGFSTTSEALILGKKLWSIPLKGQYEQLSNSISLKEMGIYTKDFNIVNIASWLISYDKIDYKWENPIYNIVEKIIKTYGN